MKQCSDIEKMEIQKLASLNPFFGDISEFIITHDHLQRLPLLANCAFLVLNIWRNVHLKQKYSY